MPGPLALHQARRVLLRVIVALAFAGLALVQSTRADDAAAVVRPSDIVRLTVEPAAIHLSAASRQQQLLITGERHDGRLIDLTRTAHVVIRQESHFAEYIGTSIHACSNGAGVVTISHGALSTTCEFDVKGVESFPPVHFALDVVPILSKLGCNSGGCHGRASGQNGFKLSVFGYDSAADYEAIVHHNRGRRVAAANPAESLIITKPAGGVPHGGGNRLKRDSFDYQVLLHWIDQGMPVGDPQAPTLVGLKVSPEERILDSGADQQILATAIYSDGSQRDVSNAAFYSGNAPQVAEVDQHGLIRCGQLPGEAAITVNYMGQVAAVQVVSPRTSTTPTPPIPTLTTDIDRLVWTKLSKMGLSASELCDDETFLRRSTLDCLGTLPTPQEVRAFLADPGSDKRTRWIEQLLARPEYADYWTLKWADILLVDREKLGERGAYEFHRWLRHQFAANRPYNQWVHELLTATGDSAKFGPVNFYRSNDTPDALARTLSQSFLGVRVECAQCHHHPFEKWSQEDYYGLAAFFHGLEQKPLSKDRVLVFHAGYRDLVIPQTTTSVTAKALDAPISKQLTAGDPRVVLADWLTAKDNPWFAKLAANRVWKHYLGRGLVEAEDDLRSTNPPTNPPLLDHLAQEFKSSGFDLKHLMRQILNSRVYQLSSEPTENNRGDEQNFSYHLIRRQPAEVLLDSISRVTGVPESFPGRPVGTRAIALWDNRLPSYFLEIFGRPERTTPCECGRSSDPTIAQSLHLMNAPEVESKISHASGRVALLIQQGKARDEIVTELTLAAIGRFPDEKLKRIANRLFDSASQQEAAEDYLWTLLNSYDFLLIK